MWQAFDDASLSAEEDAVRKLKKFFQGQQMRIMDNIINSLKSFVKADIEDSDIMDIDVENEELQKTLREIWVPAAKGGFEVANQAFDLDQQWEVVRDEFIAFEQLFGLEEANVINEGTRQELKDIIIEGLESGQSNMQIRDAITEKFAWYKDVRATTIARTETHMATVGGTFWTYEAAGIQKKEWLTTIDGREREWHQTMDGQIKDLNEPFVSGQGNLLMFPGDPNAPANEVIQCRCALLPVI
jgi:SPP1 gp7 family putative phage head morphogenesis protein